MGNLHLFDILKCSLSFALGVVAVVCVSLPWLLPHNKLNPEQLNSTMTSLENGEERRMRFVFGNNVQPQREHTEEEEEEEMMSLRRSGLQHVPDRVLKNSTLTYLCLEGNQITAVPSSAFLCWPRLQWLDLRNNHITMLPAQIGSHRCLETLLLEGNPISELPPELGNVMSLRGLNLRGCPIRFPPQDVVQQGYRSILGYLRRALAERSVSVTKTLPAIGTPYCVVSQSFSAMEKLQLSELMESSVGEEDEVEDLDGLQRFRELKDQLILLDKAELDLTANSAKHRESLLPSSTSLKKTATMIPQRPLSRSQRLKRSEGRRQATATELREKQAFLEQRMKDLETLEKWRTEAKEGQKKKMSAHKPKSQGIPGLLEEALEDSSMNSQTFALTTGSNGDRSARKLERDIHAHVERMQDRIRNPCSNVYEQMAAAEADMEEVRRLQARLLERRRDLEMHRDNGFTTFTADAWPRFLSE